MVPDAAPQLMPMNSQQSLSTPDLNGNPAQIPITFKCCQVFLHEFFKFQVFASTFFHVRIGVIKPATPPNGPDRHRNRIRNGGGAAGLWHHTS